MCGRVFARVRAHVQACSRVRVRIHACALCGCMHACACVLCVARVRAHRMCLRVCVRMHACSGAGACVRTWSGSRVPGCMRVCARAPVCVVCMCKRVPARVRAHESVRALMRECACICVWAYADMCMYKVHEHIKQRVLSQRNNTRRQEVATVDYIYIYPFLSSPSPLPPSFHGIIISLYNMNTQI